MHVRLSRSIAVCTALALLSVALYGKGVAAGAPQTEGRNDAGRVGDAAIVPFEIKVPAATLRDLNQRIDRTRWPDELKGAEWAYGTNQAYLRELVAYWRNGYDWRKHERRLNQFEQFTTEIDGVQLHFIHRRAKNGKGFPLLVTHGWPGSVTEFEKIIEPLTDPVAHGGRAEDAFDVIAPSIPGFGFSGKPTTSGYGPERMAAIFATLMSRLGYQRYGAQGGDWGALISAPLAIMDATHMVGLHLNMCVAPQPSANPMDGLNAHEVERMKRRLAWSANETGYSQIQGTKPQSLGASLNDSPVGLAAWIVEKFSSWCDCEGSRPERRFTKDELLTNIMVYWVTQTATSSARLYYESRHVPPRYAETKVPVPTACLVAPVDIGWAPRSWVERRFNLTRWNEMPEGGHFAALENPAALVADIRAFYAGLR